MASVPGTGPLGDDRLLVPYWLRAVRIGLVATVIVVGTLFVLPVLPHDFPIHAASYGVVLVGGACGALVVSLLPWRRLFEGGPWGVRMLYVWSMADIVLVSVGVATTGGGASPLFFVYALTTVFFGAAYPPRGQTYLLLFTVGAYLAALGFAGWNTSVAIVVLHLSVLATLTLLTSFMFRELLARMRAQEEARATSERWAVLLSTVAAATREMSLSRDGILDAAIDAIMRLGFDGAVVNQLDEHGATSRVLRAAGVPSELTEGVFPTSSGLTGRALEEGATVSVEDYREMEDAVPSIGDAGFRAVVLSPVWVGGWLAFTMLGSSRDPGPLPPQQVAAFEMLAQHTGLALENAQRFEEEHRMVERLAELDRLKSDFLTTVSHELRTPVTVIQGVGSTLERVWETLDRETIESMLHGLSQNARSLDEAISTLLDFSRMEAGAATAVMQPVDIEALVRAVVRRVEEGSACRPVEVDLRPGLRVSADPSLVDRILEHLINNALRHTDPDVPVRVETRVDATDVLIVVADRGPGISPDELPHLNERFFRGGDINSRPRGLGLGLSLVSEMAALMGTTIEIDSAPGWGSRFAFRLELLEDVAGGRASRAVHLTTEPAPLRTEPAPLAEHGRLDR
jgi:signal transduction histidine kinase